MRKIDFIFEKANFDESGPEEIVILPLKIDGGTVFDRIWEAQFFCLMQKIDIYTSITYQLQSSHYSLHVPLSKFTESKIKNIKYNIEIFCRQLDVAMENRKIVLEQIHAMKNLDSE